MSIPQRKFREILFQLIYSQDFNRGEESFSLFEDLKLKQEDLLEADRRVREILKCVSEIDTLVAQHVPEYAFERISRVERNVLRLASFELLFDEAIPPKVAIAEAIRICRKYGTPEGANFINGVLDALYRGTPAGAT